MDPSDVYDVIVVGSGATGGWAAMDLAERGMRVLVLEAGPAVQPIDPLALVSRQRSKKRPAWAARQPVQSRCHGCVAPTRHLFVDDVDHPYAAPADKPFDWIRGRQVGGRSLTWVGHCYRFSPLDLEDADDAAPHWPIRYDELAPFYARVEEFMGMVGTREGLPHVPDGVFCEASELTAGEAAVRAAIEARWPSRRMIPARNAVRSCDESGWPKWSSPGSTLKTALASGRVTLRPNTAVTRVLVDEASGTARGVAYVDAQTKQPGEARGRFVMSCASSMETVRILMSSTTAAFPDGIGSASRVLGRYIMDHLYTDTIYGQYPRMSGLGEDASPRRIGAYIPRFQNLEQTSEPFGFARGYQIHLYVSPLFTRAQLGDDEQAIASVARSPAAVAACAFGEMLPRAENRVTLRRDVCDALGVPTLAFECAHGANELAMFDHVRSTFAEIAEVSGIVFESLPASPPPPGHAVHEVGGARMGSDRRSSVTDPSSRTWDVPNLYVCDGSVFVTLPCQNPTLTMMALTARACEHVCDAWKRG